MAGSLDQIVNVNITALTQAVAQPSFSIPLIIGPTDAGWTDYVHAYSSPDGMLDDGFETSDPEYIYAVKLYSQPLTPTQFYVGHREAAVKQVDTFAVNTVTIGHEYVFSLNGTLISYTAVLGDVQEDILDGLNASITAEFPTNSPVVGVVTGTGVSALLTLTSSVFGQGVSYSGIDALLTHVETVANYGIQDDLALIIGQSNAWYGIALCSNEDFDIKQLASAVESLKKIFIAASNDSDIPTSATDDLGSFLEGAAYKRTALVYSPLNYNIGIDAAWLGHELPQVPGSNNWAFKTLSGISPDELTGSEQAILIGNPAAALTGKNVNIYQTVGGVNITQMGTMAGGQFIDITVGLDWLESQIQTNIYSNLVNSSKIPYTDKGTSVIISAVKAAIDQGVVNGLIDGDSEISISAPAVLDVPTNQRILRVAPTVTFTCRLQGAFNAVIVNGTVSV